MAAGFPLTREVIDNFSADRARQVQSALVGAQRHHLWLSGVSDSDLLASSGGTQRTDWTALAAPRALSTGDQLTVAPSALSITLT